MRGNEFLDKLEFIDPVYIEAADAGPKKRKTARGRWGVMAACCCLIAAAAIAIPDLLPEAETPVESGSEIQAEVSDPPLGDAPTPATDQGSTIAKTDETDVHTQVEAVPGTDIAEPREGCQIHYNKASAVVDAARRYIPGYFTEELSDEELEAVIPDRQAPNMAFTGYAGFDGEGELQEVCLQVNAPSLNGAAVTVLFSDSEPLRCYVLADEPVTSSLNGHDFEVYQWSPDGKAFYYEAFGDINGCCITISYASNGASAAQAKLAFEVIADCFTDYNDGKPDLSKITADVIPEFFDLKLTLSEAQADAEFGAYMPDAVPSGYAEESIRRCRDQRNDYLSGLWTKGYDQLSWQVSFYTEQDAKRLTGVDETENYDLSLYPIPRADSVPDGLREIVNDPIFLAEELTLDAVHARAYKAGERGDSNGWRMTFSVKYNDFIVRVSSKGVEPEWLYQQLIALLPD